MSTVVTLKRLRDSILLGAVALLMASDAAAASQAGIASWYGPRFHGKRAASGETFNENELTAAHRRLPFDTEVRVTNLANGRSVVVRINDRGPYVKGRILDLSRAAAEELGMVEPGIVKVKLEVLPEVSSRRC
jgi:rare lipoprotein A